jgi:DnaJ-domain-containing protein 1
MSGRRKRAPFVLAALSMCRRNGPISARFKGRVEDAKPVLAANGRMLSAEDRKALTLLGLGPDADRKAVRAAYSQLLRKYHPDKNGGDRSHEKALQAVIEAYAHVRSIIQ